MKWIKALSSAIGGMCIFTLTAAAASDFGQMVREFSANRHALAQDLSTRLNLPLTPEAEAFFQAAATGPGESVSNAFAALNPMTPSEPTVPALRNELWAPIHETWGAWENWKDWKEDSSLLAQFYEPILASMPEGSIYLGGTDPGRFAVTAVNALKTPPPVFCLTQNAFADNSYIAHIREVYGKRIWLPTKEDSQAAFNQYVDDVKAGRIPAGAEISIQDGKVQVKGVAGVMMINSILAQLIFDRNKDAHPFFVEESYVLAWMYPYLEPHGLILKLNPQPLAAPTQESIDRDTQFWAEQEKALMASPGFTENSAARKTFSKLRCAIAGVYEYRKLDAEAEAAYRQAIRLCPASPEASFRLANLFTARQRLEEAIPVVENLLTVHPSNVAAKDYLQQLQKMKIQSQPAEGAGVTPPGPPPPEQ